MKKILILFPLLALLLSLMAGCAAQTIGLPDLKVSGGQNFRLLVSDEANAIGDFSELDVTVSELGLLQSGDSGKWIEIKIDPTVTFDLKTLTGANASELWKGALPAGDYSKAFIYVDLVKGTLLNGDVIEIKVPSGKLQISQPFSVGGAQVADPSATASDTPAASSTPTSGPADLTEFVFDISVVKAGNSGQYLIKPQLMDSGADQEYNEVSQQTANGQNGQKEDEDNGQVKFRGTIQSIDTANQKLWTVTVGDQTLTVDVSNADLEGPEAAAGLTVKVEGTRTGNDVAATEVNVNKAHGKPDKNTQIEGTISSMASDSNWKIKSEDGEKTVDVSAARIQGDPAAGDSVHIEGNQDDDTIIARQVQVKQDNPGNGQPDKTQVKLDGTISATNATIWTLQTDEASLTVDVSGVKLTSDPKVGQVVEIIGQKTGDKIVAVSIKLK
jgi:hypothetical protein